jgi:predicted Rossmann-fold nucleotide-binding protein
LQPTKPPGISPQELERIARISDELREGIESLADIGPAVSIFGSARSQPDSWEYQSATELARKLAAHRIAVITGGGPGVMEAGNLGASEEAGTSVGLNIVLPHSGT